MTAGQLETILNERARFPRRYALAPNNPDVVWAGTGESNTRNSVSFGDGVYKSTDGGKTWQHMGLRDTERISAIVIHPQNSDIVYVGALGHAFGANEERGVFMTTDGGRTWSKTLYIDKEHGVSDLDIDPTNPNILYAGMWSFERKAWTHRSGSEKGGVYKSIDGGRTWNKLSNGLPKLLGRIGVRVAPSNTNVVYAIVEAKEGTLYRSDDRGETFRQVSKEPRIVSRGFYYTTVRVDPTTRIASTQWLQSFVHRRWQTFDPYRQTNRLSSALDRSAQSNGVARRMAALRSRLMRCVGNTLTKALDSSINSHRQSPTLLQHHGRPAGQRILDRS